jgi:hypothetical protein
MRSKLPPQTDGSPAPTAPKECPPHQPTIYKPDCSPPTRTGRDHSHIHLFGLYPVRRELLNAHHHQNEKLRMSLPPVPGGLVDPKPHHEISHESQDRIQNRGKIRDLHRLSIRRSLIGFFCICLRTRWAHTERIFETALTRVNGTCLRPLHE